MKKTSILLVSLITLVLITLGAVNAGVDVSLDTYYPSPVQAGDYFTAQLRIANNDASAKTDAAIKFKPSYPFSLDPGEQEEITITNLEAGSVVTREFKIRADSGAKEGTNDLKFQYKDCPGCVFLDKSVPIIVIEAQTTFDVVLQEINQDGVFIAISNIGKNSANAVTVRIPEQANFATKLISASIIGNLASGDYTLVGFQLTAKTKDQKELSIQIDYTDPLGIRRSTVKKISLDPAALTKVNSTAATAAKTTTKSFYKDTWFWVALILVVIIFRKTILRRIRGTKQ